jgi:hypothetical protein
VSIIHVNLIKNTNTHSVDQMYIRGGVCVYTIYSNTDNIISGDMMAITITLIHSVVLVGVKVWDNV